MKITILKITMLAVLGLGISFTSCKKENDYTATLIQNEIDEREAYLKAEGIPLESSTKSGLYYIETEAGIGVQAVAGDTVHVHYEGRLLSGYKFDSSWDDGTPYEFTLGKGEVIQGWDEAIALMKEGGRAKLIIPSELAYGASGSGSGVIQPYSTLIFYVELVDVE